MESIPNLVDILVADFPISGEYLEATKVLAAAKFAGRAIEAVSAEREEKINMYIDYLEEMTGRKSLGLLDPGSTSASHPPA